MYLSFQLQMNQKERVISEFEMDFKKSRLSSSLNSTYTRSENGHGFKRRVWNGCGKELKLWKRQILSNSRLICEKQRSLSWTQKCTKGLDSTRNTTRGPWANVQKPFTYLWQPPGVKKCFIDGEALMGLRSVPLMLKPLLRKLSKISKIAR